VKRMGRYRLIRKLANGGMAEVFLARVEGPLGFEKRLVLKRLLPHLAEDPEYLGMFLDEARLVARLEHPNLVQLFDFGEEAGRYYLAMEYVDGPSLWALSRRAWQRKRLLAPELCAWLISQACAGLAHAHALADPSTGQPLGLVHRDVSLDNLLVSRTGNVKVVDFGIAKVTSAAPRTQAGVLKGKVACMAPEYLQGLPIDSRVDVYALGVALYELVAGRKPFEADSDLQLMRATLSGDLLVYVRALRPEVPEALARIIHRALAQDRELRYRDCRELQEDLEAFLRRQERAVGMAQVAQQVRELFPVLPADEPERQAGGEEVELEVLGTPFPVVAEPASVPVERSGRQRAEGPRRGRRAEGLLWAGMALLLTSVGVGQWKASEVAPPPPGAPALLALEAPPPSALATEAPPPSALATEALAGPATLRVESTRRAFVRLNGRLAGRTPLEVSLEPGPLHVEVYGAGRRSRFKQSQQFELRAGEERRVSFAIQ
jgi:eukaryotic-like serine/threonine-protein kinase